MKIMFGIRAVPSVHKKVVKTINKKKYKIEGQKFTGELAPLLKELKFYSLEVPKEIKKEVMKDLRLSGMMSVFKVSILMWIIKRLLPKGRM